MDSLLPDDLWGVVWAYVSVDDLYEVVTASTRREIARRRATGLYKECEECSALIEKGEEAYTLKGIGNEKSIVLTCWDCRLKLLAASNTLRPSLRYEMYAQTAGKDDIVAYGVKCIEYMEREAKCTRINCLSAHQHTCFACDHMLCYEHVMVCKVCGKLFCDGGCAVGNECLRCGREDERPKAVARRGKRKQFL